MADLDLATRLVDQFFSEIADSYCRKDLDAIIGHYQPDPGLLFWNAEGDTITSVDQLILWYEELFRRFDIKSVNFRLEEIYTDESTIVSGSLWVLSTQRKIGEENSGEEKLEEEQSLRATHLLKKHDGRWLIHHLHVSPTHFLPD
ncbi:nuclear transport factor 2 family protein [Endozoicomonas sp. GU-1]|uniref:YybH family protein n=1 Tax=Endozoicomonas sp. GU-1 TaxID=3009078 RepID=UPI0022B560CA|nr:nuclear transport factor 2 family protein [Endozoicomonas sp. GU-1]WBA83094.1 nuclear transport factor 2 family protein [Endozoicomonas sp. GU-1]WBA86015.1 nuclear transport factor 2 family protein [Endozoicomonas sp. GU-1]